MNPTARPQTATPTVGSPTSASAAVPRPPLTVLGAGWQLPFLAVAVAGVVDYLAVEPEAGQRSSRLVLLVCGLLAYLVLRRWSVWSWLAALAVLPAALGAGLLDLSTDSSRQGYVLLTSLVTVGLTVAAWRARPPVVSLAVVAVGTVAGLLVASRLGPDHPARVSWNAASTFLILAVPAALGLFASVGLARADGADRLRTVCGLTVVAPLVAVLVEHGDALAALVWWPPAGALGLTAMLRGRRGSDTGRPQSDAVDDAVLSAYARRHDRARMAAVAVVIAAYEEVEGIGAVLGALPERLCGLPAEVVLVDDGSADGTAEEAERAVAALGRGHVLACPVNRGQGAALRLGYRFARERGAGYVVTTDADGQYDVSDLAVVLRPLLDDRADFVTGSRRRGALYNRDRVRQLGTYVFALLASGLLGRWLTDTSFGLRAMRPEVTARVTLNQPQYQASELLLGAASHGFRVLEVPATLRRRGSGRSKKGGNLVYGYRYGRVMVDTWWREGAPRPVTEVAPAEVAGRAR